MQQLRVFGPFVWFWPKEIELLRPRSQTSKSFVLVWNASGRAGDAAEREQNALGHGGALHDEVEHECHRPDPGLQHPGLAVRVKGAAGRGC